MDFKSLAAIIGSCLTVGASILLYFANRLNKLTDERVTGLNAKIIQSEERFMQAIKDALDAVKEEKDERKSCLSNSNRTSSEIFGKLTKLTDNVQELLKEMGGMKQSLGRVEGRLNGSIKY
jgi:tRNA pseudouridine-54 N-methylase